MIKFIVEVLLAIFLHPIAFILCVIDIVNRQDMGGVSKVLWIIISCSWAAESSGKPPELVGAPSASRLLPEGRLATPGRRAGDPPGRRSPSCPSEARCRRPVPRAQPIQRRTDRSSRSYALSRALWRRSARPLGTTDFPSDRPPASTQVPGQCPGLLQG